jgi:signal recognition particle subunit SRP54
MVLEKLGDSLKETLQKIAKAVFVDDKLINELVKDMQRALLQADVNVRLVFELTEKIRQRIQKEKTPMGLTKKEHLVHIVYEELTQFVGNVEAKIVVDKKPFLIMLVGLFGSGKTTTAGKLGKYFKKRGHKVAVVQTDTWRPAAYDQLEQLSQSIGVDMLGIKGSKDPIKILDKFAPRFADYDVVIIDTAGRDALSDDLIEELNRISSKVKPHENLLVLSADIGQAAEKQAMKFHVTCKVTGVIITKLDGTARGGGALAACRVTNAPVKLIGVGERVDDLEEFRPKGFVGRLLGMGDLEALLDKAKDALTEEKAEDMTERMLSGDFNLMDLYEQMQAMKQMGSLSKIVDMIPGMGQLKLPKDVLQVQEGKLVKWKHIMDSCTKEELEDPLVLDHSRMERIASGSGTSVADVRELVKQYRTSHKVVKMFKGNSAKGMEKMIKKMGGVQGMKLR